MVGVCCCVVGSVAVLDVYRRFFLEGVVASLTVFYLFLAACPVLMVAFD